MALDYTYIVTDDSIFVSAGGTTWLVPSSDEGKYAKLKKLIRDKADLKELKKLLDVAEEEGLRKWCNDQLKHNDAGISIGRDTVEIDGEPVYGGLCTQIITMYREGFSLEPLVGFVRKMRQNPSYRIRQQLWNFISACQKDGGFTLANDGDIMAYKVVTGDFRDFHTQTFDNSPGSVVEMPREDVDDDPSNVCSSGLHFCAYSYVNSFTRPGCRLVLVKVNPKDVVSIPDDYGFAKARCCRYEVVNEIDAPLKKPVYEEDERSSLDNAVWLETVHKVLGRSRTFTFKDEASFGMHPIAIGDVVEAYLDDYDKEYHIGIVMEHDSDDDYMPWKIGFIDHGKMTFVTWWVKEDNIGYPCESDARTEEDFWFSKLDSDPRLQNEDSRECTDKTYGLDEDGEEIKFSSGEEVLAPVGGEMVKAKIGGHLYFNDELHYTVVGDDGKFVGLFAEDDLEKPDDDGFDRAISELIAKMNRQDDGGKDDDRNKAKLLIEQGVAEILKKAKKSGEARQKDDAKKEAKEILDYTVRKMCDAAGIGCGDIAKLASELADAVFDQFDKRDSDDEDGEEDESFFDRLTDWEYAVENWLADAGRKKTARFIESRYPDLMDSDFRMRMAVAAKDYHPQDVKGILGEYLEKQMPDLEPSKRWRIVADNMRDWDAKAKDK